MENRGPLQIRVYIIEDEALLRESLRMLLELHEGIAVVGESASAEQGLQDIGAMNADVVLMDIKLPGMNGIDAIRALKAQYPNLGGGGPDWVPGRVPGACH